MQNKIKTAVKAEEPYHERVWRVLGPIFEKVKRGNLFRFDAIVLF